MGKKRIGLNVGNTEALLANLKHYYGLSVTVLRDFGGPSVYFHQEAIRAQQTDFLGDRHIEMIYATLASWGMHRMGDPEDTKAKLVDFERFRAAILRFRELLSQYRSHRFEAVDLVEYGRILESIEPIYSGLEVSISSSTLVAHSKTLAHILPHLLPPIDRQYTVRFFTQDTTEFFAKSGTYRLANVPDGKDAQFTMYVDLCQKMKVLFDQCNKSLMHVDGVGFNTSFPKIVDNLIMSCVKAVPKPKKVKTKG